MGAMSRNRRQHTRVRARGLAAHLRMPAGRVACQVENISLGGMFVRTDRLAEVGTDLFVDMVRPGWKRQLTLAARVSSRVDAIDGKLSRRMPGMGLMFVQIDQKQHERLTVLLRELGAPAEADEITLAEDATEMELRALELPPDDGTPLDPQPQPLWQQVQMAQDAVARTSSVEAAIEGALEEADLPSPGPVLLDDEAPPPEPLESDSDSIRGVRQSRPAAVPPAIAAAAAGDPHAGKLMLQLRGLVMQLSDAQQQLAQRDAEIERLREELETTRAALQRALRH